MPTGAPVTSLISTSIEFSDIDLNANATTTVYDGDTRAIVYGVYLRNGGSTAVARLEVTDDTDTATLTPGQGGGDSIEFTGPIVLNRSEQLQVNVTTVEGSAQTNTAAVSRDEQ